MRSDGPRHVQVKNLEEEVEMTSLDVGIPEHEHEHDPDSTATAPLIEGNVDSRTSPDGNSVKGRGNAFIWTLTLAACVGGLLFGYDTGVISSTLVSIGTDLSNKRLTNLEKGLITASTSFFALIASPISGILADKIGRKNIIIISDILFISGALWQALTSSVAGMIFGRSVVGLAIGGASFVVPLYIAELAPGHLRGRLTTVQLLLITGGQAVAYVIGWLFSSMVGGWRWMVGLGAVPALIQAMMLSFMPETPRYLLKAGYDEKARQVLKKVYFNTTPHLSDTVEAIIGTVKKEIREEEEATISLKSTRPLTGVFNLVPPRLAHLFGSGNVARALTIACLLQGLQQACGFNSLMYFSASIFSQLGFQNPTLTSLSISLTNFLFTCVAFFLIDHLGRRRSLLYTIPIMVISLVFCAILFKFVNLPLDSAGPTSDGPSPGIATYLIVLSLLLYVSSYATGLGPVPWQQSELFPLSVRSLGSGISTATNWGLNTVVGLTFLPMMQALTPTWTFATYAAVCVAGWVAIWWCYPETKGLEIEEVTLMLRDGWGVKESMERLKREQQRERALR